MTESMKISSICPTMFLRQSPDVYAGTAARFSPLQLSMVMMMLSKETGRLTDERIELGDEGETCWIGKQQYLQEIIADGPEDYSYHLRPRRERSLAVLIPPSLANLKRVDLYERLLVLTDRKKIPLDDIADIKRRLLS